MQFTKCGSYLVFAYSAGLVKVWSVHSNDLVRLLHTKAESIWSIDTWGDFIAVGSSKQRHIEVFDLNEKRVSYKVHSKHSNSVRFTPCGRFIISAGHEDKKVCRRINPLYFSDSDNHELANNTLQYKDNIVDYSNISLDFKQYLMASS